MIDIKARERIIRERQNKGLINQLVSSLRPQEKPDTITEPINKVAEGVQRGGNISTILVAFVQAILKAVKDIKVSSPTSSDVQDVSKAIKSLKFPETEIPDNVTLNPIQQKELVTAIKGIEVNPKVEVNVPEVKVPEIKIPKIEVPQIKVPEVKVPQIDFSPLLKAIEKIKLEQPRAISQNQVLDISPVITAINELGDTLIELNEPVKFPKHFSIDNFPPQYIPPAVTHVNINSLIGSALASVVTVTNSATPLPASPLSNRRSMIVFNNSSNVVYLGGSGVTVNTGFPVNAGQYSPPIDAGTLLIVYGIASISSEVRVFEVSDESSGR